MQKVAKTPSAGKNRKSVNRKYTHIYVIEYE